MADVCKKVRVSKNKKKSWRKHSNIDEVEEHLEEERFNERTGGAASKKPDETLYFVEKKSTDLNKAVESPELAPARKKIILENLKCLQGLKSTSQVPVPLQPNFVQKRTGIKALLKTQRRKIYDKLRKKDSKGKKLSTKFYDIWANNDKGKSQKELELDQDLLDYTKEVMKEKPPKVPAYRYQKPSLLPAVEVPLPGASYNPDYNDHQNLLLEALKIEKTYEKECNKIERSLTEMFPTIDEAPTQETWLQEMSQGLKKENDEETNENEVPDETVALNPPVRVEKKSKQKKRKEKDAKLKIKESIRQKLENKRLNEIYRLRSIKKELNCLEALSQKKQKDKDKRLVDKMYKPRTISKYKYEAPLPEFNLSEELTGQLRTVKIEGNILEDRYKSLQRRNIIEPRVRQKRKRKYKIKVLQRRTHKDIE